MLANLLESLELPAGARIAVQTEKSVEALMLYLAVLRAGYVYLPLNSAYQAAEIEYFIGDAEPSVFVCTEENFARLSKIAFKAGTAHVFTLGTDRGGSLLQRAAHHGDRHTPAPRARRRARGDPLHQRHDRPQQGGDAVARQPAQQRAHAAALLGLAARRRADPRAADLPRPRPVRRVARRAAQRQPHDLVQPLRRARGGGAPARCDGLHGRADALRAPARRARASTARRAGTCASSSAARRRC